MKVLVVGATGALGPDVIEALVERGHVVVGTTTSTEKQPLLRELGAEAVVADILDLQSAHDVVNQVMPEALVNLATRLPAAGPRRIRDMRATNRLRRQGTANLLGAAERAGVRRYVGESMIFIYGYGRQEQPATETQEPARRQASGLQEVTDALIAADSQLGEASARGAIEGVSLRFGLFHSAEATTTQEMARQIERRRFPLIGGGEAIHSWVSPQDAATAVTLALEADAPSGVYNVVDDQPVRFADYAGEIARLRGAKAPRVVPSWMVRPFASYVTTFLADVQLPVSNARVKQELGWSPTQPTYREALAPLGDVNPKER